MLMEKPSCIQELKDLTSKLADRDVSLKESFKQVKTIIDCKKMTPTQKIKKIKELCNGK
jgi:hypothetical protein|tara:strand:+ start:1017 stop:1193 length:177 start_codon:yes stop_codon:yes gene_type:complete